PGDERGRDPGALGAARPGGFGGRDRRRRRPGARRPSRAASPLQGGPGRAGAGAVGGEPAPRRRASRDPPTEPDPDASRAGPAGVGPDPERAPPRLSAAVRPPSRR